VQPALPRPGRWDAAAVGAVLALLIVAYVLVPRPVVQYGAWLAIFCVWMLWFVAFGVRWVYGEEER
jgi:thiol:disulfide interchange protein